MPLLLDRRALLSGCGAALLSPSLVRGQGFSAIQGREGWLFLSTDGPAGISLDALPRIVSLWRDAAQAIEQQGIRVVIALIPSKFRVYADKLPGGPALPAEAERRLPMELEILRAGGLLVPDLLAAMAARRRAEPATNLFFKGDTHWTPSGAASAAAEIARVIQAEIRLPPSRTPGVRLGAPVTETRLQRDLVQFLPPAERANYPSETFAIRRPANSRAGLLDDAPSDVAVIGPSFMRPEYNFATELSAALNRPVSLHWRDQNIGPYATMLEYLRGPVFRRERPKVLVWGLIEGNASLAPENRGAFPQHAMPRAEFLSGVTQALAAR